MAPRPTAPLPNQHNRFRGREGFVLIATLATILIGSMWAASAAQRMTQANATAQSLVQTATDRGRAHDALSAAVFLASTSPRAACGWQPSVDFVSDEFLSGAPAIPDAPCLKLDGRRTPLIDAEVEFQDVTGLFSVRTPPSETLDAYLANRAENHGLFTFSGSLRDFLDRDGDPQLGGGEALKYRDLHLEGPPNRWPRTPYEVFNAAGWSDAATPLIANRLALSPTVAINMNSAPVDVLAAIPEFNPSLAQTMVEHRNRRAFDGAADLQEVVKEHMPDMLALTFLPSENIRIRVAMPDQPVFFETSITRPDVRGAPPWSYDYILLTPAIDAAPVSNDEARARPNRPARRVEQETPTRQQEWLNSNR